MRLLISGFVLSNLLMPLPSAPLKPAGPDWPPPLEGQPQPLPPGWAAYDRDQWRWVPAADGSWALYATRRSAFKPSIRRPNQVCWLPALEWRNFILTAEVWIEGTHHGRDAGLFFAGRSPSDFYYLHLCESSDDIHHNLMRVLNADREPVSSARNEDGIPEDTGRWMPMRLEVNAEAGTMRVFADNQTEPTISGDNLEIGWGRIGLGAFDDITAWRNVVILGPSRPSTAKMDGEEGS